MRKIVYSMQMSLDGYMEDASGSIGFTHPEPQLHAYFNELEAGFDTHIYGRRLYETMNGFWPTAGDDPNAEPEIVDYARIWNALDKVVYSRGSPALGPGARMGDPDFAAEVARLKASPGKDISVGGATLAREFIECDLVDEFCVIVYPLLLGGGKPMFPAFNGERALELFETRSFPAGAVVMRYSRKRS